MSGHYPIYATAALKNQTQEVGMYRLLLHDVGNGGFGSIGIDDGSIVAIDSDGNVISFGGGSGDMILASVQTVTGAKTFNDSTLLLRNVAGTFSAKFTNTNTAARTYTLPDAAGTIALTSNITGTNSGTNTGDQTITLTGMVTGSGTGSFVASLGSFTKSQLDTAVSDGNVLYVGDSLGSGTYTLLRQSGSEPSVTPTGTTATLDLNAGNMQTIGLGSASGNVTLTLTIPTGTGSLIGSILAIQGATPRNLILVASDSSTIRFFDTKQDTSTDAANTTRGYHWRWNGSNLFIGQTAATTT